MSRAPELHASTILPSGTLTFLFTDIEGSTCMWDQYPELTGNAMVRHDALIESAVERHAGLVIRPRGEGDSRFAVFNRASDALRAAIAIQYLISTEPWTIPKLRVRVALHSGEAQLCDGDYYGSTVNRCARLRNAAHGGQILVSETTHFLVRDDLPTGVSLRDLGEYILKGLERPERIFQPVIADLPSEFPPLNSPEKIHNNLPLSLTSFVGREKEIDELEHLLWKSRSLTISGPGGAGKTRLAIQVVQKTLASFPDGVWFIDLAPLTNSSLLIQYVMNILGVREEAGYSPLHTLADTLKNKTLLLILDNCEHMLPEVTQLAETILFHAPSVRILSTSREKLGIPGEIIWRIPSLSSPDPDVPTNFEKLMQYEAVRLFQDRAVAARTDFKLTRENANAVAQICSRLDGIPLAIELAAARVQVLSVEEILFRLDDRFRLLVGNRTALPRQQTLRSLVNWSYDLLAEKERMLLRRLSVFSGGWTLEATELVCSGKDIEDWEVLDTLTSLIDKSFVVGETFKGHQRFHFLETILKFSQERLLESQETDEFAHRHAVFYLKVATNSYSKMWGQEQAQWLARLDEELENLRSALAWFSEVAGYEEKMLQMAGSLWRYWEIRGYIAEGRAWLESALAKNPNADEYLRANGLGGAGHLARQQGDYMQAGTLHEQSLSLFRKLGFQLSAARQLNALGQIALHQGDYTRSIELHQESLSIRKEIGDKEGIAASLRDLGVIARDRGQYQQASGLLEESLQLSRKLGDKLMIAYSLNDLGLVAYYLCEYQQATIQFEEAISMQQEFDDRLCISESLKNLGSVAKDQGDFKRAEMLLRESLSMKKNLGDKRGISRVITTLAEVAFWQGKYPLAAELARQGLALSQELGVNRVTLYSLELLGFIAFYQGNYEIAASFAEKGLEMSSKMDVPQAIGYARVLLALGMYSEEHLVEARDQFSEALTIFQKINDCKNTAATYVNLARTAYRQGDYDAAMQYLDESLSISKGLNLRWTRGFVLEIMGLIQRKEGNYGRALELFQESLRLSIEQENLQGIANCTGALAGLAVLANQPARAARYFATSARLRREMRAKMSNNDYVEYEQYLTMVHKLLDHLQFEAEWSEGFSMTADQICEDMNQWVAFWNDPLKQIA